MSEDQVEVETETFSEFLKSLTQSKDSINKVTKYAITNAHLAQQFLDAILKRMRKVIIDDSKIIRFLVLSNICILSMTRGLAKKSIVGVISISAVGYCR